MPYHKGKIFWEAFLAATIVGLVVACFDNSDAADNNVVANGGGGVNNNAATSTPSMTGGGDPMGQQMRMEANAMNMNGMVNESVGGAARDGPAAAAPNAG